MQTVQKEFPEAEVFTIKKTEFKNPIIFGGFVFGAAVMFFFGNFLIPKKAFFKGLNEKDGKKKNPWIQD